MDWALNNEEHNEGYGISRVFFAYNEVDTK